jgi:eukaryotic-like serine/threonine-protein kinase
MADADSLVGGHVEQYEILKHIARGGMADVYLAYEEELQRKVALKIMLPALAADEQYVVRFRREAQTVARLDHPNIVHVYAIGLMKDGRPYIAMQYVEGGSLSDTMAKMAREGRLLETTQSLSIIGKMADALQVAHAAGITHRDIKPSNILIRPDGRPVLVDLGIAAVTGGPKITQTGTLIGTPHYMSPEQATGKKIDGRTDLYSLGVILYEMLAGKRPFDAEEPLAVLHQHIYEQPPPLEKYRPDLIPETVYLVHRCLRKDPEQRFQTAAELRGAINMVIKEEGGPGMVTQVEGWIPYPTDQYRLSDSKIQPPPSTPPLPASPVVKPQRQWWPFVVISLLLIIMCMGAFYFIDPLNTFTSSPREPGQPDVTQGVDNEVAADTPQSSAIDGEGQAVIQDLDQSNIGDEAQGSSAEDGVVEVVQAATPTPEQEIPPPTAAAQPTSEPTLEPTLEPTPEPTVTPDLGPETTVIGRSVLGSSIEAVRFGSGNRAILFVGGLHAGSAPSTVSLAQRVINHFTDNPAEIPSTAIVYVISNTNPDSPYAPGELSGRLNGNNVDLNRNWDCRWVEDASWRGNVVPGSGGPAPFSEPETQALAEFILDLNPAAVIFWEARAQDGLSSPGTCGTRPGYPKERPRFMASPPVIRSPTLKI